MPGTPSARNAAKLLISLLLTALMGCATQSFRTDVRGYTESYAQVSDQQMLYNLARLNCGLPPYFLTVGQINSSYEYDASDNASVGAAGGLQRTSGNTNTVYSPAASGLLSPLATTFARVVTRSLNLGNTVGGSVESTPSFTYIPLNGDSAAKEFLTQIQPEIFEHFCQQGWPIDQLLRVLVDRIEMRLPNGEISVLTNSPTRGSPESYVLFLRVCGELRKLQRQGKLIIRDKREIEYFGQQTFPNPTTKDLTSANAAGYSWYKVGDNAWMIGRETDTAVFTVLPQDVAALQAQARSASLSERNLIALLQTGISISSAVPGMNENTETGSAYIVLRSISTALSSVATEENSFYDVLDRYPADSPTGIPYDECRPAIELLWDKSVVPQGYQWNQLLPSLLSISFQGKTYKVTDPLPVKNEGDTDSWADQAALSTWNRDTFRLLVEIQSEIGVDLSKFQNQVIQWRQQQ
jgi:hypothetical protein